MRPATLLREHDSVHKPPGVTCVSTASAAVSPGITAANLLPRNDTMRRGGPASGFLAESENPPFSLRVRVRQGGRTRDRGYVRDGQAAAAPRPLQRTARQALPHHTTRKPSLHALGRPMAIYGCAGGFTYTHAVTSSPRWAKARASARGAPHDPFHSPFPGDHLHALPERPKLLHHFLDGIHGASAVPFSGNRCGVFERG